eukprot:7498390-Pyramimonas_sp.AAC.1
MPPAGQAPIAAKPPAAQTPATKPLASETSVLDRVTKPPAAETATTKPPAANTPFNKPLAVEALRSAAAATASGLRPPGTDATAPVTVATRVRLGGDATLAQTPAAAGVAGGATAASLATKSGAAAARADELAS